MNDGVAVGLAALWSLAAVGFAFISRECLANRTRVRHRVGLGQRGSVVRRSRRGPGERLGTGLQRVVPLFASASPRWLGRVVLVLAGITLAQPLVGLAGVLVLLFVVRRRRERERQAREEAVRSEIPEVVDLFRVATASGLTVPWAMAVVGGRGSGPVSSEFALASQRVSAGQPVAVALEALVNRAGDPARPLVTALLASVRYGAELAPALQLLAHTTRLDQRRRAEERARRIPVRLLVPLVICILPAFGLLTVVPLLAGSISSLGDDGSGLVSP